MVTVERLPVKMLLFRTSPKLAMVDSTVVVVEN